MGRNIAEEPKRSAGPGVVPNVENDTLPSHGEEK